jgi:8-oxo-dGTP pyrophosphatase MutT (NUDIX family)
MLMSNNIICRNCGKLGHKYKDCISPRLSYGIVLFNDYNEIIMIERKESISYIEFLRGKYKIEDPEYIQLLFDRMSAFEKDVLLKKSFHNLWNNLWYSNVSSTKDYMRSIKKFKQINKRKYINDSNVNYLYNEWEIPKGRRNLNETDLQCAVREFKEETNISINEYDLLDIKPFEEEYTGSNNIIYKNVYYIGKIKNNDYNLKLNRNNVNQISEIRTIKWLDKNECLTKIRDYSDYKLKVVNDIFNFIYSNKNNIIL